MKLPFMNLLARKRVGHKIKDTMRLGDGFSPRRLPRPEIAFYTKEDRREAREEIEHMLDVDGCLRGKSDY